MLRYKTKLCLINYCIFLVFLAIHVIQCTPKINPALKMILQLQVAKLVQTDVLVETISISYSKAKYYLRKGNSFQSIVPTIVGSNVTINLINILPDGLNVKPVSGEIIGIPTKIESKLVSVKISKGNLESMFALEFIIVGNEPRKTGITQCWNELGNIIACLNTGQDGDLKKGSNDDFTGVLQHPTQINDHITIDNLNGLTWKTCREGVSSVNCSIGAPTLFTWSVANTTPCNNLNIGSGYYEIKNWRVPKIQELQKLFNHNVTTPASYATYFPNDFNTQVWSGSENTATTTEAFMGRFSQNGEISLVAKTFSRNTRCVSGEILQNIFYAETNDTSLDMNTSLIWTKCTDGLSGNTCANGISNNLTWNLALITCKNLTLNNQTWRLPNINELKSLVNYEIANPSIEQSIFTNTENSNYWSSTTFNTAGILNQAYAIDFRTGITVQTLKSNQAKVRCVSSLETIQN